MVYNASMAIDERTWAGHCRAEEESMADALQVKVVIYIIQCVVVCLSKDVMVDAWYSVYD